MPRENTDINFERDKLLLVKIDDHGGVTVSGVTLPPTDYKTVIGILQVALMNIASMDIMESAARASQTDANEVALVRPDTRLIVPRGA
jgi:hypothetical protein